MPPRPFSVHDNRAIEDAWLGIHKPYSTFESSKRFSIAELEKDTHDVKDPVTRRNSVTKIFKGALDWNSSKKGKDAQVNADTIDETSRQPTGVATTAEVMVEPASTHTQNIDPLRETDPTAQVPLAQFQSGSLIASSHVTLSEDPDYTSLVNASPVTPKEIKENEIKAGVPIGRKRSRSPFGRKTKADNSPGKSTTTGAQDDHVPSRSLSGMSPTSHDALDLGSSPTERSTTGTPFLRIPSRLRRSRSRSRSAESAADDIPFGGDAAMDGQGTSLSPNSRRATLQRHTRYVHLSKCGQHSPPSTPQDTLEAKVPVGVSRLHVVELPSLKVS